MNFRDLDRELEKIIRLCASLSPLRDIPFLTTWFFKIFKNYAYLPCIDNKYITRLALDKTKLAIFITLADDLAGNFTLRNERLLNLVTKIPKEYSSIRIKSRYLRALRRIWTEIIDSIKEYPRYNEFRKIFLFDVEQTLLSIKFEYLINTIEQLGNSFELKIYIPFEAIGVACCDIDLMCSPSFDKNELGRVRPIFYLAQYVCHIGNVINTFPKELLERDYSCPLILLGLEKRAITKKLIEKKPKVAEEKLRVFIPHLDRKARICLKKMRRLSKNVKSIDVEKFVDNVEKVYEEFLKKPKYWEKNSKKIKNSFTVIK